MKSLSQQIYDEGRIEGRTKNMVELSVKYMKNHNCTLDAALDALDIDPKDRSSIIAFVYPEHA